MCVCVILICIHPSVCKFEHKIDFRMRIVKDCQGCALPQDANGNWKDILNLSTNANFNS